MSKCVRCGSAEDSAPAPQEEEEGGSEERKTIIPADTEENVACMVLINILLVWG